MASSPLPSSLHGNKLFISTFFCSLIAFLFTASEPQTRTVHWESLAIFFGPIFAYLPEFAGNKRLQLSFGCKNQKLKILRNKMSLYLYKRREEGNIKYKNNSTPTYHYNKYFSTLYLVTMSHCIDTLIKRLTVIFLVTTTTLS